MYELQSLVKRHMLRFLRDKTAVFFSFLSIIILLALYFLFIGKSYTSGTDLSVLSDTTQTYVIAGIMMGGILVINTISLSLGMMGNIIMDLEQRKLDAFLVTPVKRYKIILSYYLSSIIVTATLTLVMWILTILYVGIAANHWYSLSIIINVSLYLILFTFISATLMIYLTTLLKSVNAFGTLSGIIGTFIGFVSGIYMPLISLGKTTTYIASVIPFTHMAIILKQMLLKEPMELMIEEGVPLNVMEQLYVVYGTTEIGVLGNTVSMTIIMIASLGLAFALLYFAYRNMTKKMGK